MTVEYGLCGSNALVTWVTAFQCGLLQDVKSVQQVFKRELLIRKYICNVLCAKNMQNKLCMVWFCVSCLLRLSYKAGSASRSEFLWALSKNFLMPVFFFLLSPSLSHK